MKSKLLSLIITLALSGSSLRAANIAFVSFHPADNTPDATATTASFTNAPDVGYTKLLAANGHTVTRFQSVDNIDTALLPDGITPVLTAINTNDLVIISRSVASGHYQQANETVAWNGITKPVILMSGFITRGGTGGGSRLGLTTGETTADVNSNPMRLKVNAPGHPIFAGIALNSTNLMVNPFSQRVTFTNTTTGVTTLQVGISVNNNATIAGGTVLATVGTPGDAAANGMVVGEFPAGLTVSHTGVNETLAGKRLMLLTGSREAAPIPANGAGIYDLQPDGATVLLNAVTYLTTSQLPKCTVPLVGATNLVAGDAWTFSAGVIGDAPLTYQWYKDGSPLPAETSAGLTIPSLTPANVGEYQLYVTNALGWSTSTVARLDFLIYPLTSITNSIISYWPLDGVVGAKSPDLVSSYDMTLTKMGSSNIVAGKWGTAFEFNNAWQSLMARTHAVSDDLPAYKNPNFTVSIWVNAAIQSDHRAFSEGSTTNTNPLFDLGTHNTGADSAVDLFIRSDGNVTTTDHRHSTAVAYDGTWHNIVYVQRDVGNGNMRAQLWVDGLLDPVVIVPIRPLTANTTAIGGLRRAADSSWFTGLIDEVAVWNRALSPEEVGILQVTPITNAPSRIQPLTIASFKTDLPGIVSGDSTTLRWEVSKDATSVTISGIGNVTGQTSVGIGSQTITPAQSTNYVLTVTRGVDTLSATTSVAVVTGVAPGWALLDNFDQAKLGSLFSSGYWNDTSGNGAQVSVVYGNQAARATSAGISFLNLRGLSVQELQARTLFFRMIPGATNAAGVTNIVGLTDKSQRNYGDEFANIGPVLYPTPFTNSAYLVETNGWYLGARNFPGGAIEYYDQVSQPVHPPALEAVAVYNVWIDITNAPLADSASDTFTVYIQKEGGGPRAVLFQDYTSDRDLVFVDPVLGGIAPNLDKLVIMGNSATLSATFDDFYLSTSGYNATVPKASGFLIPPGPLTIGQSGNQLQISWPNGTLQSSTNATGPYIDVPGNPTSPYLVTPSGDRTFYRSRN